MVCAALLTGLSIANTAAHDVHEHYESRDLSDRLEFRLGFLASRFETDVAAGNRLAATIRLEDIFDYDKDVNSLLLSGRYRFGSSKQHALRFGITDFNRSASGIVTGAVPIYDVTFVGSFDSKFDVLLLNLNYEYSFFNNGQVETGVSAGLAAYEFDLALNGAALVADGTGGQTLSASDNSSEFLAPVPTIGFYTRYAITPKLIVGLNAEITDLEIDVHDGRVVTTRGSLAWYPWRHFGFGLSVSATDITYQKNDDLRIQVNYSQSSGSLFVSTVF